MCIYPWPSTKLSSQSLNVQTYASREVVLAPVDPSRGFPVMQFKTEQAINHQKKVSSKETKELSKKIWSRILPAQKVCSFKNQGLSDSKLQSYLGCSRLRRKPDSGPTLTWGFILRPIPRPCVVVLRCYARPPDEFGRVWQGLAELRQQKTAWPTGAPPGGFVSVSESFGGGGGPCPSLP